MKLPPGSSHFGVLAFVLTLATAPMTAQSSTTTGPDQALAAVLSSWPSAAEPGKDSRLWLEKRAALRKLTWYVAPEALSLVVQPYDQKASRFTFSVKSADPAVPVDQTLSYTTKSQADFKKINDPLKANSLKARIVWQVWAPDPGRGRTVATAVELGTVSAKGVFSPLLSVPLSGAAWDFEPANRQAPVRPRLIEAVLVEGGGDLKTIAGNHWGPDPQTGRTTQINDYTQIPVDEGFYMAKTAITQELWVQVMGTNPSRFKALPDSELRPVESVNYFDAVAFCNRLSILEGLTPVYTVTPNTAADARWPAKVTMNYLASGWRLPLELEYRYASWGGTKSKGFTYAGSEQVDEVSWHLGNSGQQTHPVAQKKPNELGLYDMQGNTFTWLDDTINPNENVLGGAPYNGEPTWMNSWSLNDNGSELLGNRIPVIGVRVVRNLDTWLPPPVRAGTDPSASTTTLAALMQAFDKAPAASAASLFIARWLLDGASLRLSFPDFRGWDLPRLQLTSADGQMPFSVALPFDVNERQAQVLAWLQETGQLKIRAFYRLLPASTGRYRVDLAEVRLGVVAPDQSFRALRMIVDPINANLAPPKQISWLASNGTVLPAASPGFLLDSSPLAGTGAGFLAARRAVSLGVYQHVMSGLVAKDNQPDTVESLTKNLGPVTSLRWIDAVRLANRLSEVEGLAPVYTVGDQSTVKADAAKNGWRLPTAAELELLRQGALLESKLPLFVWDGGTGAFAGTRAVVRPSVVAGEPAKVVWVDPSQEWFDDAGVQLVRRDPKRDGVVTLSTPALQSSNVPAQAEAWVLVNKAAASARFLSLDPELGKIALEEAVGAKTLWKLNALTAPPGAFQLRLETAGKAIQVRVNGTKSTGLRLLAGPEQKDATEGWRLVAAGDGWFRLSYTFSGLTSVVEADPVRNSVSMAELKDMADRQLWKLVARGQTSSLPPAPKPEPALATVPNSNAETLLPVGTWIVKRSGLLERWDGTLWVPQDGTAVDIGTGPQGSLWALGTGDIAGGKAIWQRKGNQWETVAGSAVRLSVDPQGLPWVVNDGGTVFQMTAKGWKALPGLATDIGVGAEGSVWIIGRVKLGGGFSIEKWTGTTWNAIDGAAVVIAVDPQGAPWVINDIGTVYQRQGNQWFQVPRVVASDLAIGSGGRVVVIEARGSGPTTARLSGDVVVLSGDLSGVAVP